jgi:hypothetical protein
MPHSAPHSACEAVPLSRCSSASTTAPRSPAPASRPRPAPTARSQLRRLTICLNPKRGNRWCSRPLLCTAANPGEGARHPWRPLMAGPIPGGVMRAVPKACAVAGHQRSAYACFTMSRQCWRVWQYGIGPRQTGSMLHLLGPRQPQPAVGPGPHSPTSRARREGEDCTRTSCPPLKRGKGIVGRREA